MNVGDQRILDSLIVQAEDVWLELVLLLNPTRKYQGFTVA
jgi:hypothetical protein